MKKYIYDIEMISTLFTNGVSISAISKKTNIPIGSVRKKLKKLGYDTSRKIVVNCNHNAFEKFTKESCYWAGFIAADGNIYKNRLSINLSIKDENHLIQFKKFLVSDCRFFYLDKFINGKTLKHCQFYLNSKKIKNDLENNFKIVPRKTRILEIPLIVDIDLIRHFIRGYFDGDGSISWHKDNNKPRIEFASGSLIFINWVQEILTKNINGIGNPSILQDKKWGTYKLDYNGFQVIDIMNWLYEGSDETNRLDRKFNRFIDYKEKVGEIKKNNEEKEKLMIEKHKQICLLRKNGLTYKEISKITNYSVSSCCIICKKTEFNVLSQ